MPYYQRKTDPVSTWFSDKVKFLPAFVIVIGFIGSMYLLYARVGSLEAQAENKKEEDKGVLKSVQELSERVARVEEQNISIKADTTFIKNRLK